MTGKSDVSKAQLLPPPPPPRSTIVACVPPTPLANGGIPAGTVVNVGWVESEQQADAPSNEVKTPIVAVLGEKETRRLPFTGAPVSIPLAWRVGALLVGIGIGLAAVKRRRVDQR